MSTKTNRRYTPEEYIELERKSEIKSEYFNGEVFAMGGSSKEHNLITGNIFASLHAQVRQKPCEVFASDMRVKVSSTGLYTYPDVIAVCGESRFEDEHVDTLVNPTVVFEVLSESSEKYDRGRKFEHYRRIESLREYLLVSQDRYHVDHYVRQPDNSWLLSEADSQADSIELPSVSCRVTLAEIYDKVRIEPSSSDVTGP